MIKKSAKMLRKPNLITIARYHALSPDCVEREESNEINKVNKNYLVKGKTSGLNEEGKEGCIGTVIVLGKNELHGPFLRSSRLSYNRRGYG